MGAQRLFGTESNLFSSGGLQNVLTMHRDESFRMNYYSSYSGRTLRVKVYNSGQPHTLLGSVEVALYHLVPGGGTDDRWFPLSNKDQPAGEVRLVLSFDSDERSHILSDSTTAKLRVENLPHDMTEDDLNVRRKRYFQITCG